MKSMATIFKKLAGSGVHSDEVPFLYTTGSFQEVGYDIGKAFSDRIKQYWIESHIIQNIVVPYAATAKGKEYYETTLAVSKLAFPQYIKELQGMSEGSGIPFEHLFLLCVEKEIYNVLEPAERDTSLGCTDILVNSPSVKLIAHTEDSFHLIDKFGYIVSARIIENGEEVESFTAYCYPGGLPGGATSFNRHGMVFSCDGLYPDHIVEKTPPRDLVSRSIIKAKNIEEAVSLAKNTGFGVAFGFTINMADVKNPSSMWCLELGPQTGESKTQLYTLREEADASKPCHYVHTNTIRLLSGIKEMEYTSSTCRLERANQMEPPRTREGALTILGDTTNREFPIFRTADPPSSLGSTIYTAVFDILENRVDFYHGNPVKNAFKPSFHFQIKDDGS